MGIFDDIAKAVQQVQDLVTQAKSGVAELKTMAVPQPIQNMETDYQVILKMISGLEATVAAGSRVPAFNEILGARIEVYQFFCHLMQGGAMGASEAYKLHPTFVSLKSKFGEIDARLRRIEKSILKATFGFRQKNGSMILPSVEWSKSQWETTRDASERQTGCLWSDEVPGQCLG